MRVSSLGAARTWKRFLGELLLIVVGVLIALGGNSWWEGRKDRARERTYLEQLLSDMNENEKRLQDAIAGNEELLANAQRFVDVARGEDSVPSEGSLWDLMTTGYDPFEAVTGTYTGLLQSGELQLVRNDALRHEIMTYAAAMEGMRDVLDHLSPWTWQNVERVLLADVTHSQPEGTPEDWQEAMLSDPQVITTMFLQRGISSNRVERLRGLEQPTRALRCMLAAELEGVEAVEIAPASARVDIGETADLEANVRFGGGLVLDGCPVSWASDAEDVASVNNGEVMGIARGDATATGTFAGISASASVSVEP